MGAGERQPFSADEAEKIREALAVPDGPLICPACGGQLSLRVPPDGASSTAFWLIQCDRCGRGQMVQDII